MKITCPHCGYEHNVSEKIAAWSDYCWGCKKFFDWRPHPIVAPRPIPAAQQKMHPTEWSRAKKSDSLVIGG